MIAISPQQFPRFARRRVKPLNQTRRKPAIVPRADHHHRPRSHARNPLLRFEGGAARRAVDHPRGKIAQQSVRHAALEIVFRPRPQPGAAMDAPQSAEARLQRRRHHGERHAQAHADHFDARRVNPRLLQQPLRGEKHRRRCVAQRLSGGANDGKNLSPSARAIGPVIGIIQRRDGERAG